MLSILISTHHHTTAILFAFFSLSLCFFSPHHFICMSTSLSPKRPPAVDVWSVGCIVAEMIRGSVLFPGTDRILPHHWLIDWSLCHHFILCEEIQIPPESFPLLCCYPFSNSPPDKHDLHHCSAAPHPLWELQAKPDNKGQGSCWESMYSGYVLAA